AAVGRRHGGDHRRRHTGRAQGAESALSATRPHESGATRFRIHGYPRDDVADVATHLGDGLIAKALAAPLPVALLVELDVLGRGNAVLFQAVSNAVHLAAVNGDDRASRTGDFYQPWHTAADAGDTGHFRHAGMIEAYGSFIGKLGHIGAAGAGVDESARLAGRFFSH